MSSAIFDPYSKAANAMPSGMSWVFVCLHNSVGLAFAGAVVGEYLGPGHSPLLIS